MEKRGTPQDYVAIYAPRSGTLIERNIADGAAARMGQTLLTIADLSRVWVEVDVFEADLERGLLMMLYLAMVWRKRIDEGSLINRVDLMEAIVEGASQRIRPMLMTGLALLMGLVPIMYSTGAGTDVMKRIAAPMLGGVITALIMVLLVLPAIFAIWRTPKISTMNNDSNCQ